MQFILTPEEFTTLNAKAQKADLAPDQRKLQELCTLAANAIVIKEGWRAGHVWGCILTVEHEWYCDDCPAREVCPTPHKHWSK